MSKKTCGECKYFLPENTIITYENMGECYLDERRVNEHTKCDKEE